MVRFLENWFSDQNCKVVAELAASTVTLEGDIIEIGSWAGKSTCAIANAVAPQTVIAVDTWEGSPGEISEYLAGKRDVFAEFMANVNELTAANVIAYRMGWREYFSKRADRVKFCFIDAEHTYDEVKDNIETVLPLMVPGGIICGDDVQHEPIQRAVLDVLGGDVRVEGTVWSWRAP